MPKTAEKWMWLSVGPSLIISQEQGTTLLKVLVIGTQANNEHVTLSLPCKMIFSLPMEFSQLDV